MTNPDAFAFGMATALLAQWVGSLWLSRARKPRHGWGARQLPPPPPAPGMRREYLWSATQMAECGGPCWEAQDPCYCTCGALWRDVPREPVASTEGPVQRGQGNGGPATEKPPIKPQPHGGRMVEPWP